MTIGCSSANLAHQSLVSLESFHYFNKLHLSNLRYNPSSNILYIEISSLLGHPMHHQQSSAAIVFPFPEVPFFSFIAQSPSLIIFLFPDTASILSPS